MCFLLRRVSASLFPCFSSDITFLQVSAHCLRVIPGGEAVWMEGKESREEVCVIAHAEMLKTFSFDTVTCVHQVIISLPS